MPAAEPAGPPTPPTAVNAGEGAAVIPINARRTGRGALNTSGGWKTVDTPPTNVPDPSMSSSERTVRQAALRLVADDMERIFNSAGGRSLTDEETAAVFVITLGIVEHALKGSVVSGIISEEQRAELAVLIEGMREAPRLV